MTPNPGSLQGTVTTGTTPIPGAVVLVRNATSDNIVARGVTTQNGEYLIENIAVGTYNVTVSAEGFQTQVKSVTVPSTPPAALPFNLLSTPASITGTVTDAQTGQPITGANIQVRVLDSSGVLIASIFTANTGVYLLENLAPGTYSLVVSDGIFQTNISSLTLQPGETRTANIALLPNPGFISGTVVSTLGNPVSGATVNISDSTGLFLTSVITGSDGTFLTTGLAPGNYTATIIAEGFQTQLIGAVVTSNLTTPTSVSVLASPGTIVGSISPLVTNTIVRLFTADNIFINAVAVDNIGNYRFDNLAPGPYVVIASAPNYAATSAGAIVAPLQETTVTLTLTPNPATVSGRITSSTGVPIPNAVLQILDNAETIVATATTDANGNYSVGSVPPGTYSVTVTALGFGNSSRALITEPNESITTFSFQLTANPGEIAGQITTTTGIPIAGATVLIRNSTIVASTTTSTFGNYVISNLAPGTYTVVATASNFSTELKGAIVASNTSTIANLTLTSTVADLTGRVTDVDGNPITGENIEVRLLSENGVLLQALVAQTDGSFLFPDLVPGTYFIQAVAPNYASNTVSTIVQLPTTNVTVPLALTRAAIIGTVNNEQSGTPIAGAVILVTTATGVPITSSLTDSTGQFVITNLPPGVVSITVTAPSFGSSTTTEVLTPSETAAIVLSLTPNPGSVSGFITNVATGSPIIGATITALTQASVVVGIAVSDAFGQYIIPNLTTGQYRIVATAPSFTTELLTVDVVSNVSAPASFALSPNPGFIRGVVREAGSNTPISNINVQARYLTPTGPLIQTTLTDENGIYITGGLQPGTYTLTAFSDEYGNQSSSVAVVSNETTSLDFLLTANATSISGTVTDLQGNALANATIRILDGNESLIQSAETNGNGQYTFLGIAPGQYIIIAISPNYQRQQKTVTVASGSPGEVNFALAGNPGTLTGSIRDAQTDAPLAGAIVEVFPIGSTFPVARRTTDGLGQYTILGLAPGQYTVVVSAASYASQTTGVTILPGSTSTAALTLAPNPASIAGTVTSLAGTPVNNATINVFNQDGIVIGTGVTDVNGNYVVGGLPQGAYTIIVTSPRFANELLGITLLPGQKAQDISFSLTPNPGTLAGTVISSSGTPLSGAVVSVLQNGILVTSSATDRNGIYTIRGLSPGVYVVAASAVGFSQAQLGASIISDETTSVHLSLTRQIGQIAGLVTDRNGSPIRSVTVSLRLADSGGIIVRNLQAEATGEFLIPNLEPGQYILTASAAGFQATSLSAIVRANETENVVLSLQAGSGTIIGRVIDEATRRPIAGSIVNALNMSAVIIGTAVTGEDGFFLLTSISVGTINVVASATNYGTASHAVIVEASATSRTELALSQESGILSGFITTAASIGIAGARILVTDAEGVVVAQVLTDNNGSYFISSLAPGTYTVTAFADGFGQESVGAIIIANRETIANLQLTGNTGSIAGRVINERTGQAISGASVQLRLTGLDGPVILNTITDEFGQFLFADLQTGRYGVTASMQNFTNDSVEASVQAGNTTTITLNLALLNGEIRGIVRNAVTAAPLSNTVVRVINETGAIITEVQTDVNGEYVITSISPGSYTLVFFNTNFQNEIISVTIPPNERVIVNANLQPNPATLQGTVVDAVTGLPIAGALIQVFDLAGVIIAFTLTDTNGRYIILGIGEGTYSVIAQAQGYAAQSERVALLPGEVQTLSFTLGRNPSSLSGKVTDENGEAVIGAIIRIFDSEGDFLAQVITDENGSYFVGSLPAGTLTVTVEAAGFIAQTTSVTLAVGQQLTDFDFILAAANTGSISGYVQSKLNCSPVVGAQVTIKSENRDIIRTLQTNQFGSFLVTSLPAGSYTITVSASGYESASLKVTITARQTTNVQIHLLPSITKSCKNEVYQIMLKRNGQLFIPPCTSSGLALFCLQGSDDNCATFTYVNDLGIMQSIVFDLSAIVLLKFSNKHLQQQNYNQRLN